MLRETNSVPIKHSVYYISIKKAVNQQYLVLHHLIDNKAVPRILHWFLLGTSYPNVSH